LLRRVLRGDDFPRVHPPVDLANLWAIVHGLPVGLYDVERLEGSELVLRVGAEGESYAGIRKPQINLSGRLTLADAAGPFGNPSADSLRTSVHAGTRSCLAVVFATTEYPAARLERWCDWLVERAPRLLGADNAEAELI
jgi:DNA/RNA-binding domain of Phe-tRNA-synthetase-like protein